jgi:hypothetical protein
MTWSASGVAAPPTVASTSTTETKSAVIYGAPTVVATAGNGAASTGANGNQFKYYVPKRAQFEIIGITPIESMTVVTVV